MGGLGPLGPGAGPTLDSVAVTWSSIGFMRVGYREFVTGPKRYGTRPARLRSLRGSCREWHSALDRLPCPLVAPRTRSQAICTGRNRHSLGCRGAHGPGAPVQRSQPPAGARAGRGTSKARPWRRRCGQRAQGGRTAARRPSAWHTSLAPTARRGLSGRVCRSRRARDRSHVVPGSRPNLPCGSVTSAAPFAARAGAPALDLCRTAHSSERRAALWQPPGRDPSDPSVHAPAYEPDRAPVRSRAPHARWAGIPTVLRRSCAGPAQNMSSEWAQRTRSAARTDARRTPTTAGWPAPMIPTASAHEGAAPPRPRGLDALICGQP